MKQTLQSLSLYMMNAGNEIAGLRLIVEGAVVLYENEAFDLITLPDADDNPDAVTAFDTIGTALYDLRDKFTAMQQEHRREIDRQIVPEN